MEKVAVYPTSKNSAVTDEILLRETSITKLVFRPMLVNNAHDKNAAVKGVFVFQKKNRNGSWIDFKSLSQSNLKATEWIQLEIKSDALLKLVRHLNELYEIHAQEGIPRQKAKYVKVETHMAALLEAEPAELAQILELKKETGLQVFLRLLDWFAKVDNREQIVSRLEDLKTDGLQKLNTIVGLGNLKTALSLWNANKNNSNEEFWQQTISQYSVVTPRSWTQKGLSKHNIFSDG